MDGDKKMLLDLFRKAVDSVSTRALTPQRQRPVSSQRLFCSQPFSRFEVLGGGGERGDTFFCCQNWVTRSIGNISEQPVEKVWNSRAAQAIRRSILDNSFRYCRGDVCPYLQRVDGPVKKIEDVSDPRMLEMIREKKVILPFGPSEIICCFDQSCNLSCPTCRKNIIMESDHAIDIANIQKKLETEALGDARLLYITGSGDPFGSPFFRHWLQTMDLSLMPKLERIHLHTNGLLWTKRIWESIPARTRELVRGATISIDAATPETYAINRRGGEYKTLIERLQFIGGLRKNGPLDYLECHMTVQCNNFREIPDFIELGRRFGSDRVSFHKMLDWGTFSNDEFAQRAVHLAEHKDHHAFLEMLADPRLKAPIVYLSNLSELAREASAKVNAIDTYVG
jgi:MoaA/NifB/PqqE/SkfB family radical SAM enzyme